MQVMCVSMDINMDDEAWAFQRHLIEYTLLKGSGGTPRALIRILKTGVQDPHLAKSRSPTPKSWSPTNSCKSVPF